MPFVNYPSDKKRHTAVLTAQVLSKRLMLSTSFLTGVYFNLQCFCVFMKNDDVWSTVHYTLKYTKKRKGGVDVGSV